MLEIRKFVSNSAEEWKSSHVVIKKTDKKRESEAIGLCPKCKGAVLEATKSFSCEKWREGCKFTIWKKIAGKKISIRQVKKILKNGKSDQLKGFRSKSGKSFSASLELKDQGVVFVF